MKLSREMRRLAATWSRGDFPKHIEWLEIDGLRGWNGERVDFKFPIVAIVGENGAGKSTIIQAVTSVYESTTDETYYASKFFPDSPWDEVTGVSIKASVREGNTSREVSIRKPTTRWRGNETRRKRAVKYLDLRRTQPIYARVGFARIAKRNVSEEESEHFAIKDLDRYSKVIGKSYNSARRSTTDIDDVRQVPVVGVGDIEYSGFHQGAGEATVAELIAMDIPSTGIVLIDEIETSLHPRAQRRLIRDLAVIARNKKTQIIVTTHSPYVLEELPPEARVYVSKSDSGKGVVPGVSPEFALSRMDEEVHPEADVYVEDGEARILLEEILAEYKLDILPRISIAAFGAASVGKSLGIMVVANRFRRPTVVILDGDQEPADGCHLLPGEDAPERVVFEELAEQAWSGIAPIINRSHAELTNALDDALTQPNHHEWINSVADRVIVGGNELWRAMCRQYVKECLDESEVDDLIQHINDFLE